MGVETDSDGPTNETGERLVNSRFERKRPRGNVPPLGKREPPEILSKEFGADSEIARTSSAESLSSWKADMTYKTILRKYLRSYIPVRSAGDYRASAV